MASFTFDEGANQLTSGGSVTYTSDTIQVRLVTANPSQTATVMTGITGVGTDQVLGGKSKAKDTTNHRIQFKGSVITWTAVAAGSTIAGIVFYKFITNDASSIPLFYVDVTDIPTNGSDLTFTPDATNGVGYLQQ